MNFVLCGMMGSGKTTVGKSLARETGFRLVDTDALIALEYGKISDLFVRYGEPFFRDLEKKVALFLREADSLVIASGGGFILNDGVVELMKKDGVIVYLRAKKETLLKRLKKDGERPLLEGEEPLEKKLDRLLSMRAEKYAFAADITVDVDGKTPDEIALEIIEKTKKDRVDGQR